MRPLMFRTWICVLAVALIAVSVAPTVFHAEHGADQDCAVCNLRNQPIADLSGELQVRPTEAPEALAQAPRVTSVLSYHGARIPARAPPLSVFPA